MQEIPIVLIGEKDHGKSTLIGRLLLDTKTIKERKIKEIKEADKALGKNFELAHLVDSFREEREMEMTFDTTTVLIKGKKRNYLLIDVPGHRELIAQMLTGASKAKSALLIVAVDEGIKKQTILHLEIAKILGIEKLGVVVNKMDKVNYKKENFEKIAKEAKAILKKLGYSPKETKFLPISAFQGDNVCQKSPNMSWYEGLSVLEYLEKLKPPFSLEKLPFSFLVQDVYEKDGEKILVGRVETGKIKRGEKVLLFPEKKGVTIKTITDAGEDVFETKAGESVGIILKEKVFLKRGNVLASFNFDLRVSNSILSEIFWLKEPKRKKLILECGTAKIEAEILEPKKIKETETSFCKISLKEPLTFETKYKTTLNKIVLKERGKIIAVGKII